MPARRGAAFRALALRGDTGGDNEKTKDKRDGRRGFADGGGR